MKKFGFTIKTEKMDEQEIVKEKEMEMDDKTYEEIMETAESLATLIDYKMMDAAFDLGIQEEYTNVLDEIWCHKDNLNNEAAISVLYAMAIILDRDSKILLRNLIMPSEIATDLFLEFFCEYLADARIFEQTVRMDALRKMGEQMASKYDDEDDEPEELHDIHYEEIKTFFKKVGDEDE